VGRGTLFFFVLLFLLVMDRMDRIKSATLNLIIRVFFSKKKERPLVEVPEGATGPLVVIVPGSFLGPSNYRCLRHALLRSGAVVATAAPDWRKLDVSKFMRSPAKLVDSAMSECLRAVEHCPSIPEALLKKNKFGRYDKLICVLHSLSGPAGAAGAPLKKSAGVVLLGSSLQHAVDLSPAIRAFPFPVLSIFGDYDGQQHIGKVAVDLSNSGLLFSEGTHHQKYSFAFIEKCNHAFFSDAKRNERRGDLSLDGIEGVSQDAAMSRVARLIVMFASANGLMARAEASRESAKHLEIETECVVTMLTPFLRVLGRATDDASQLGSKGASWAKYSLGREMLPVGAPSNCFVPYHPGEMAEAERFACEAQMYVLGDVHKIVVQATVHTVFDTFLRSKVSEWMDGDVHVIEVQCYLSVAKGTEYSHVSPIYSLKLKDLSLNDKRDSPSDLFHDLSWARAKASCPPAFLERYQTRGKVLKVKEKFHCIPPLWAKTSCVVSGGTLTLQAINVEDPSFLGDQRPAGLLYYQIPSVAWCMEHMLVHGLKD
jgi:hypothetical protein